MPEEKNRLKFKAINVLLVQHLFTMIPRKMDFFVCIAEI